MAEMQKLTTLALALASVAAVILQTGCERAESPADSSESQLVVASWGGAYQDAQREAFFEPFSRETGIQIVEASSPPNVEKFYEWQETGTGVPDVVDVETLVMLEAGENGLLHAIDFAKVDTAGLMSSAIDEFGIATAAYADVIAWNSERNPDWKDITWPHFWNVQQYPGARGLRDLPVSTFEAALMGTGAGRADVYPIDTAQALNSLSQLTRRTHVALWESGNEPIEWLISGDVALTTAWNGRVHNAREEGKPIEMTFDGAMIDWLWWVIPENAPHPDLAQQFIAFTLRPDRQAELARLIPYGPTNREAIELLDEETLADLPTSPQNFTRMIVLDNEWWSAHAAEVQPLWREWKMESPNAPED